MTEDGRRRTEDGRRKTEDGNSAAVVCYLFLAFLLISVVGCGKKSPPFVPQERPVTGRVAQLEGVWYEKSLVLNGVVQGDESLSKITGCRVYYVWYPPKQPPCEGCPIAMTNFRDITGRIIDDGRFACRLPAFRQRGICFVTVRLMENGDRLGPESGRIKLISEH